MRGPKPFGRAMDPAHRERLETLRPEWLDLMARDPRATPFQSPAWCVSWWEHLGGGELFVLEARAGGRLIGLLPGFVWVEDGRRQLMPLGLSHGDYQDVLIDPAHADAAWMLLAEALRADAEFECVVLPDVRPEAWARGTIPGWQAEVMPGAPCPTLTADADGLMAAVPKKMRRNLNLARNRAAAVAEVAVEQATCATIPAMLDDLAQFSGGRWRAEGALNPTPVQRFHHAAAQALGREGRLRMWALALNGAAVAVYYGLVWDSAAGAFLCAFDGHHPRQSFGALLVAHAIESAEREGAREFHFLRGSEPYKYDWGATDRINARVTLWPE